MRSTTRWSLPVSMVAAVSLGFPLGDLAAQEMPHRDALGNITFALTGDAIISRKLSVYQEPEFLEIRDLMRNATVAFTNAEILFLNYDEEDVIPVNSTGTYMRAAPVMAEELVWMGVDLVSLANNHAMDYLIGGLRANKRWVGAAGLVGSGTGENLAEARAPGYLETPGGRVALISVFTTGTTANVPIRASRQRADFRGRPGLNPLGSSTIQTVPAQRFEQLRQFAAELQGRGASQSGDELELFGNTFRKGNAYSVATMPNPRDLEEIVAAVRDAKRQANWVMVSVHNHQSGKSQFEPADFVVEFAHAAIDAGADVWVGHGPHILRGIEIYKGKPILYSLGNLLMENETPELQPADQYERYGLGYDALPGDFYDARINQSPTGSWPGDRLFWEAVVAVPEFRGGQLVEVRLHPTTLGFGLPRAQRGRPLAAKGELARKIIADLQRLSEPFGTTIAFENGIGVIRLRGSRTERNR